MQQLAGDDAFLFLWVTANYLPDGLEVMRAWGFVYRTNIVWVKDKIGLGYYVRHQHELCLIGRAWSSCQEPRSAADGYIVGDRCPATWS